MSFRYLKDPFPEPGGFAIAPLNHSNFTRTGLEEAERMRTLGRPYNASFSTDRKVTVCGLCAVAFLALLAQFAAAA